MKRFTETTKWQDPWFRKLLPNLKCLWFYILDNCDNAGVWKCDQELAKFQVGKKINWEIVREEFKNRIMIFGNNGEKWYIKKFIAFQYGNQLSENCKPHKKIIDLLKEHGILKKVLDKDYRVLDTLPDRVSDRVLDRDKEKDQDQDQEKEKEKEKDIVINKIIATLKNTKYMNHLSVKENGEWIKKMLDTYIGVDFIKMIMEADAWLISNPKKLKKNYKQFLNNWFKNSIGKDSVNLTNAYEKSVKESKEMSDMMKESEAAAKDKVTPKEMKEILKKTFPEGKDKKLNA